MVIFPLAVLKFLLGLFWPKIKGEKPILAILGENCLRVTASGKLVTFFHPLEVFESFSFLSHVHVRTLFGQLPHPLLAFFPRFWLEKAFFGKSPSRGENIASGGTPGENLI